jgi:N12 class adenine-specific DNA methylase
MDLANGVESQDIVREPSLMDIANGKARVSMPGTGQRPPPMPGNLDGNAPFDPRAGTIEHVAPVKGFNRAGQYDPATGTSPAPIRKGSVEERMRDFNAMLAPGRTKVPVTHESARQAVDAINRHVKRELSARGIPLPGIREAPPEHGIVDQFGQPLDAEGKVLPTPLDWFAQAVGAVSSKLGDLGEAAGQYNPIHLMMKAAIHQAGKLTGRPDAAKEANAKLDLAAKASGRFVGEAAPWVAGGILNAPATAMAGGAALSGPAISDVSQALQGKLPEGGMVESVAQGGRAMPWNWGQIDPWTGKPVTYEDALQGALSIFQNALIATGGIEGARGMDIAGMGKVTSEGIGAGARSLESHPLQDIANGRSPEAVKADIEAEKARILAGRTQPTPVSRETPGERAAREHQEQKRRTEQIQSGEKPLVEGKAGEAAPGPGEKTPKAIIDDLAPKPGEPPTKGEPKVGDKRNGKTFVGKNSDGEYLWEDGNGVRHRQEPTSTILQAEPVAIRPTRGGVETVKTERQPEYMTVEEQKASAGPKQGKSFRVAVQTEGSPDWVANQIRFKTEAEAESYRSDLEGRWSSVTKSRVEPAADAVTHEWKDGSLQKVGDTTASENIVDKIGAKEDERTVRDQTERPPAGSKTEDVQGTGEGRGAPAVRGGERGQGGEAGGKPAGQGAESVRGTGTRAEGSAAAAGERGTGAGRGEGTGEPGPAPKTGGVEEPPAPTEEAPKGKNYRITDEDEIGRGSSAGKREDLVNAIKTLKKIESENRAATPEEQRTLARFPGWGWTGNLLNIENEGRWDYRSIVDLLTPEELKAARAATLNSHFTSPPVVRGFWKAMARLGFTKGKALETSAGHGLFLGLGPEGVNWHAVELDDLTGRILKQLYPEAKTYLTSLQKAAIPEEVDVAASNFPFGNYPVTDRELANALKNPALFSRIHNYFFVKSLDRVRPGGIVAAITSNGTLDASDAVGIATRNHIADQADFLGAIRLPNDAFKANAGTEVTTDIIFLRKRFPDEPRGGAAFQQTALIDTPSGVAKVNEYFIEHPEMVLGEHSMEGKMYGRGASYTLKPREGEDLGAALDKAIQNLPEGVYQEGEGGKNVVKKGEYPAPPVGTRQGSLYTDGKGVYATNRLHQPELISDKKPDVRAAQDFIGLREQLLGHIRSMQESIDDAGLKEGQAALKTAYETFVKNNGPLNGKYRRMLVQDPDSATMLSLEKWDGEDKKVTGLAPIFDKRVIQNRPHVESVDSSYDALVVSIHDRGKVDLPEMARLAGKSQEEVAAELKGHIWFDPAAKKWVTSDEYGSGNVRKKLVEAQERGDKDAIDFLTPKQPRDLEPEEITANPGASWIPTSVYDGFMADLLKIGQYDRSRPRTNFARMVGNYNVSGNRGYFSTVAATEEWGAGGKNFLDLFEDVLNGKQTTITYRDSEGKTHVDDDATRLARAKQDEIKLRWYDWVYEDTARAKGLADTYNREINNLAPRAFDGSQMTFPGKNPLMEPRPHQANAAMRIVQTPTQLLHHSVGTGKSGSMAMGTMELRRTGIRQKILHVVPKTTLAGYATAFRNWYPGAKILVAEEANFNPAMRKRFAGNIATGDWDAIIMSQEQYASLPMSPAAVGEFFDEQIAALTDYMQEVRKQEGSRSFTVKQLQRIIKSLEARLDKIHAGVDTRQDASTYFENLGIDHIMVDEAEAYKNLLQSSGMKGMSQEGSLRAFDMLMKVDHVRKNGGGITFASGTPISNSVSEMHTLMRYLAKPMLDSSGMTAFDAWAHNFLAETPSIKQDVAGRWQQKTIWNFGNIPELRMMYREVADMVHRDDVETISVPRLMDMDGNVTNKPIIEESPVTDAQRAYFGSLKDRADKLPKGPPQKGADNILNISTDGRKSSIDLRTVDPKAEDHPDSKVNKAIANIIAHYKNPEYAKHKATQMVFLDIGTPGGATFDLYNDMKAKLIRLGIPEREIAFAQEGTTDAKMAKIEQRMRDGDIRVLFASTEKGGRGINVQDRIIALHHLDPTWKPSQIEQRDGRGIRQGNMWDKIHLHHYVVPNSFDSFMWDKGATKQTNIDAVSWSESSVRSFEEDLSENPTFSASEIAAVASGDPRMEKFLSSNSRLRDLETMRSSYVRSQRNLKITFDHYTAAVPEIEKEAGVLKDVIKRRDEQMPADFEMTIGKKKFTDQAEAGEALLTAARQTPVEGFMPIGEVGPFKLETEGKKHGSLYLWIVDKETGHRMYIDIKEQAGKEDLSLVSKTTIRRISNRLAELDEDLQNTIDHGKRLEREVADAREQIGKPWKYEEEYARLQREVPQMQREIGSSVAGAGGWGTAVAPVEPTADVPNPQADVFLKHAMAGESARPGGFFKRSASDVAAEIEHLRADVAERQRQKANISGTKFSHRRGAADFGVDPAEVADAIKMGGLYAEYGLKFGLEWTHEMVSLFGETIRPHLEGIYAQVRKTMGASDKEIEEEIGHAPIQAKQVEGAAAQDVRPGAGGETGAGGGARQGQSQQGQAPAGTGQAPQGKAPGKATTIGISQKLLEERGLGITPGLGASPQEMLRRGRLIEHEADARMAFWDKHKRANGDDIAAFRARDEKLEKGANRAFEDYQNAVKAKAPSSEVSRLYNDFTKAKADVKKWAERIKPAETEWQRMGSAMQGKVELDTGSWSAMSRAVAHVARGADADPTPQEVAIAQRIARIVQEKGGAAEDYVELLDMNLKERARQGTASRRPESQVPVTQNALRNYFADRMKALKFKAHEQAGREQAGGIARPKPLMILSNDEVAALWQYTKDTYIDPQPGELGFEEIVANVATDLGLDEESVIRALADVKGRTPTPEEIAIRQARLAVRKGAKVRATPQYFSERKAGPLTDEEAKTLWTYAKRTYIDNKPALRGLASGDEIPRLRHVVSKVADDLGISEDMVKEAFRKGPETKEISDAMWYSQHEAARVRRNAQMWVDTAGDTKITKALMKILDAPRAVMLGGHGTVAPTTHSGPNWFDPQYFDMQVRATRDAFLMTKDPAVHARLMRAVQRHENFEFWVRNGLKIGADYVEDYSLQGARFGARGMDVLKIQRLYIAEREWKKAPAFLKANYGKELAKEIVQQANHMTGAVDTSKLGVATKAIGHLTIAPSLEGSRWARTIIDPFLTMRTGVRALGLGKSPTPVEMYMAKVRAKRAGRVVGTYMAALLANQVILKATGQDDDVNILDPTSPDWMAFKWRGYYISPLGGVLGPLRLIFGLGAIAAHHPTKQEEIMKGSRRQQTANLLFGYGLGKLNPLYGIPTEIAFRRDYSGNPLPTATDEELRGKERIDWLTYGSEHLPIPIADMTQAVREGMKEKGLGDILPGLFMHAAGTLVGMRIQKEGQKPKDPLANFDPDIKKEMLAVDSGYTGPKPVKGEDPQAFISYKAYADGIVQQELARVIGSADYQSLKGDKAARAELQSEAIRAADARLGKADSPVAAYRKRRQAIAEMNKQEKMSPQGLSVIQRRKAAKELEKSGTR